VVSKKSAMSAIIPTVATAFGVAYLLKMGGHGGKELAGKVGPEVWQIEEF
jgi:hypothetical protein